MACAAGKAGAAFAAALLGTGAGFLAGAFAGALAGGLLTGFSSRVGRIGGPGCAAKPEFAQAQRCTGPLKRRGGVSGRRIVAITLMEPTGPFGGPAWCTNSLAKKSEKGIQTKHCSKP